MYIYICVCMCVKYIKNSIVDDQYGNVRKKGIQNAWLFLILKDIFNFIGVHGILAQAHMHGNIK